MRCRHSGLTVKLVHARRHADNPLVAPGPGAGPTGAAAGVHGAPAVAQVAEERS